MKQILLILILLAGQILTAQEIYIEVSKDKVAVNEQFTYSIVTHKKGKVIAPDFEGFKILRGPDYGESTVNQYINGKHSSQSTYTYTYTLRGVETGIYTIDNAKLKINGNTYTSEKIKITVNSQEDAMAQKIGIADYYLTLTANKESVFVGEPFILSLKYYCKQRPNSVEGYQNGSSGGIWRKDLRKPEENYIIHQENIKGSRYYIIELKKELCIPINPGIIDIEPSYGSVLFNSGDFFSQYRQEGYSNSVEVEVKPLPGERPDDFNGLVGSFDLSHNIDRTTVNRGEAIEINITLEGSGNFNSIDQPSLNLPESFLKRDPAFEEETQTTSRGIEGKVNYRFSFTPSEKGTFKILPYQFSYFDLNNRRFKRLSTDEIEIEVKPAKGGEIYVENEVENPIDSDINYIHEKSGRFFTEEDLFFGSLEYSGAVASPILLAIFFVLFKYRQENMSDTKRLAAQQKVVRKSALKKIENSRKTLAEGKQDEALKQLQNSMNDYFKVKLQMSLSDLSQANIAGKLKEKGITEDAIEKFRSNWTQMEMAQYAPIGKENLSTLMDESKTLIKELNKTLS